MYLLFIQVLLQETLRNLVSRKMEKELKGIEGIKEINSTSIQDFSSVFVEFETDVDLAEARREVQEAVDRIVKTIFPLTFLTTL